MSRDRGWDKAVEQSGVFRPGGGPTRPERIQVLTRAEPRRRRYQPSAPTRMVCGLLVALNILGVAVILSGAATLGTAGWWLSIDAAAFLVLAI